MAQYAWEGHAIDVRFRLQPQVGWLGGGFVVRIDGGKEFQPPRELEAHGTATPFDIDHHGRVVPGVVRSVGRVRALGTAYEVQVDGGLVDTGHLRAENWFIPFLVLIGLFGLLLYLLFRMAV